MSLAAAPKVAPYAAPTMRLRDRQTSSSLTFPLPRAPAAASPRFGAVMRGSPKLPAVATREGPLTGKTSPQQSPRLRRGSFTDVSGSLSDSLSDSVGGDSDCVPPEGFSPSPTPPPTEGRGLSLSPNKALRPTRAAALSSAVLPPRRMATHFVQASGASEGGGAVGVDAPGDMPCYAPGDAFGVVLGDAHRDIPDPSEQRRLERAAHAILDSDTLLTAGALLGAPSPPPTNPPPLVAQSEVEAAPPAAGEEARPGAAITADSEPSSARCAGFPAARRRTAATATAGATAFRQRVEARLAAAGQGGQLCSHFHCHVGSHADSHTGGRDGVSRASGHGGGKGGAGGGSGARHSRRAPARALLSPPKELLLPAGDDLLASEELLLPAGDDLLASEDGGALPESVAAFSCHSLSASPRPEGPSRRAAASARPPLRGSAPASTAGGGGAIEVDGGGDGRRGQGGGGAARDTELREARREASLCRMQRDAALSALTTMEELWGPCQEDRTQSMPCAATLLREASQSAALAAAAELRTAAAQMRAELRRLRAAEAAARTLTTDHLRAFAVTCTEMCANVAVPGDADGGDGRNGTPPHTHMLSLVDRMALQVDSLSRSLGELDARRGRAEDRDSTGGHGSAKDCASPAHG